MCSSEVELQSRPHPSISIFRDRRIGQRLDSKMLAESGKVLGEGGDERARVRTDRASSAELERVPKSSIQRSSCSSVRGTTRCGRQGGRTAWRTWSHPGFSGPQRSSWWEEESA